MTDAMQIADILVENIKRKYSQDIAIVAYYGSYARGDIHEKSDLDFFLIPDNDRDICPSLTFMVDDIGYDFWPIRWDRAERMASLEESKTSVIADSKILYSRSDRDLKRFQELQKKPNELSTQKHRKQFIRNCIGQFRDAYTYLYNMKLPQLQDNVGSLKIEADKVITTVLDSLALLNQVYFSKGWVSNAPEIEKLEIKPKNLLGMIDDIVNANIPTHIVEYCDRLVFETRNVIVNQQNTVSDNHSFARTFTGFYEEFKSYFNKIIVACDKNDFSQVWGLALGLQNQLATFLAQAETGFAYSDFNSYDEISKSFQKYKLTDLTSVLSRDRIQDIRESVVALDRDFKDLLHSKGINFSVFGNVSEFRRYVDEYY